MSTARYVLAIVPRETAQALDACPNAACAHPGARHSHLDTCLDCSCGTSGADDHRLRASLLGRDWVTTTEELQARGLIPAAEEP